MITSLYINNEENPLGLDETPVFSWVFTSGKTDVMQTQYQIQVISHGKVFWDTGVILGDTSTFVRYEGAELRAMTEYRVQVSVWDTAGDLHQATASFETGLLTCVDGRNFKAEWITHAIPAEVTSPAVFATRFTARANKAIARARLYATACGVYEADLNGTRVGDVFMAPGWTSYHHRLQYQTYDITALVAGTETASGTAFASGGATKQGSSALRGGSFPEHVEGNNAGTALAGAGGSTTASGTSLGRGSTAVSGTALGDGSPLPERVEGSNAGTALGRGAENTLAVTVGNGWFKGFLGFDEKANRYGDRTALKAMVAVFYTDGTVQCVGTDASWQVETRAIQSSEIYYGETCDLTAPAVSYGNAVLAEAGTTGTAGTTLGDGSTAASGTAFGGAGTFPGAGCKIVAQESEPVRVTERVSAKERFITPKGEVVYDFGQNLTGLVEVTLPPLTGKALIIRHAETLDKDGNFYTENLRSATSTDTWRYTGADVGKTVMPHFTFHGFRYIAVEGVSAETPLSAFTACVLHTDMKPTLRCTTSNKLVNQLLSNIRWGQRGNFLDIPTDCPQRNERLGWTGDAQVFAETASLQYGTARFFKKWLRDMAAETTAEWGVPHVIPNILGDQDGAAAWSDAATVIPWTLYQTYGDLSLLREQYPLMKAWVEYVRGKAGANGLWQTGFQYGDWLALDIENGSTDRTGGTDKYLVANAWFAHSAELVAKAARALGMTEEAAQYQKLFGKTRAAINREYVTRTGRIACETQTACVLLLAFNLTEDAHRERILSTLKQNIEAHHNHLTTGFVGTPYLCHCLSENGLHDLATAIFMKEDFPGWFYAVKKGATTIWERWNSILPDGSFDQSGMNSLNHYAYGSIASWLYRRVAGLSPLMPGYKRFLVAPELTEGISRMELEFDSPHGTIGVTSVCENGKINVTVTVPANTRAVIRLPESGDEHGVQNGEHEVGSGTHHFEYETTRDLSPKPFTRDSTLGDLVAADGGKALFEKMAPGMFDSPMIQYAYPMTVSELIAMSADTAPLYQTVIDTLNANAKEKVEA